MQLSGRDDRLVDVAPLLAMVANWRGLLDSVLAEEQLRDMRHHGRTGCPLGDSTFVERLEQVFDRVLRAGSLAVHLNCSNIHNRFVSPESPRNPPGIPGIGRPIGPRNRPESGVPGIGIGKLDFTPSFGLFCQIFLLMSEIGVRRPTGDKGRR